MKNHILLSMFLLFLVSCHDELDLVNRNALTSDIFWKTEKDLNAGVNAVYKALHGSNENVRTFEQQSMLDAVTDIATARTVSPYNAISSGVFESNNLIVKKRWEDCYRGIIRANDVIKHLGQIEADPVLKKTRLGEVLFLRSWFYFNLIYFFGAVPLVLDVPTIQNVKRPRTEKEKIIQQLHNDLDSAIFYLPIKSSENGRATRGAALTLKAKLYIQELDYVKALDPLKEIMKLNYSIYPDYGKLFSVEAENNPEVIFDIQFMSQTGMNLGNRFNTLYGHKSLKADGWSWLLPTKELINLYDTKPDGKVDPNPLYSRKDPRMDMTVMRPGAFYYDKFDERKMYPIITNYEHAQTGLHCRKLVIEGSSPNAPFDGYWDSPQNFIIFRYADVLLLYAEAELEVNGASQGVYDALNQVRQRANVMMPKIEENNVIKLREIIRKERAVELALEGWRYFDLLRWGLLKEVNDNFELVHVLTGKPFMTRIFPDRNVLWPIPLTEIDLNSLLEQNNGY
jgi:hypothetical protein